MKTHLSLLIFTCATWGCSEDALTRVEPGTVEAPIWTESSASITIVTNSFFDTWGPDAPPPVFSKSCKTASRGELTDAQLKILEGIELVPLQDQCTSDGYSYVEVQVHDDDGTTSTFRDTGCDFLKVEGAKAMLPADPLANFQWDQLTDC